MKSYTFALCLVCLSISLSTQAQSFRRLMNTANKQYEIHAFNQAIESYREALNRKADDVEALSKIADCYRHLNLLDEANRYYARAVQLQGVEPRTLFEHGLVLKSLARYDEAKQWFLVYARDVDPVVGNNFAQSTDFAKQQLNVSAGFTVNEETVNTPYSDFGPQFAGMDQATFSSARTDLSVAFDGQATNLPFVSTVESNSFLSVPYLLQTGYEPDRRTGIGPISYSPDGSQVAITLNNFIDGTRHIPTSGMAVTLYLADVNPSGQWVNVRPFAYNSGFNTGFATFSPDGSELYFASDRSDSFGGYDIYRARRVGNSYANPENLGPIVNSVGNEITPYFTGNTLYFASDYHPGLGSFDIFSAEEQNRRFTQIYHLGAAINSSRDDYGFVFDEGRNIGYVVSNRSGGTGNEDIYHVSRSARNITLVMRDGADGALIPGTVIDFGDCGDGAYQADETGRYVFQVVQGLTCNLVVGKDGYSSTTVPIGQLDLTSGDPIVVTLNKLSESYPGKLVDYNTQRPVPSAMITVTNRATGESSTAISNASGDYFVALNPYTSYDFFIEAPGYEVLSFRLPVGDGFNRDILGILRLLPGGSTGAVTNPDPPLSPVGGGSSGPVAGSYAVQVAALNKAPNLDNYRQLANLGNLYYVQEGNQFKVRVGGFTNRTDAQQTATRARGLGYNGAFPVRENNGSAGGSIGTPTNPGGAQDIARGNAPYKVQLGAYSRPNSFDRNQASSLGTVESRAKNNLTVFYIGNIRSLEEARTVRSRARSAGYSGAFILVEEGNNLRRIN